jgi:hypothetical protein
MTDDEIRNVLLTEGHAIVASSASQAVSKIGAPLRRTRPPTPTPIPGLDPSILAAAAEYISRMTLTYPPENILSDEEEAALISMKLSSAERAGLEKLIAEACAATLFHFFCVMDAVGDPEVEEVEGWTGARFATPEHETQHRMLHDDFGEMYWKYKATLEARRAR